MKKLFVILLFLISLVCFSSQSWAKDLAGSIWRFYDADGDVRIIFFEKDKTFTYLNLKSKSNEGRTYGDDDESWTIYGNQVLISFNNGYREISLNLNDSRNIMMGSSKNKKGDFEKVMGKLEEKEVIFQNGIFLNFKKSNPKIIAKQIAEMQKTKKNYAEVPKSKTSSKELDALKRKAEETKLKRIELERKLALLEKEKQSNKAIGTIKRQEQEEKEKIKELEQQLALLKKEQQSKPKTIVKTEPKSEFSNKPININFKSISKRPDDIAVIIGNANYEKQGKDIPNVNPAYADAEGIKQYFMQALGVKEGNIIYLKDATAAQLLGTFGDKESHKGQLYNWVKPNVSNVYVYYAGHGVPGGNKGNAYLVPTDADSQTIQFSGYPLSTLYSNLGKLSAKSITVILEACFSGASQAGNLFSKSSPIVIRAKKTMIPKNVKVISAGAVDQMASWEKDKSHGLFTKYFLKAMSGEGDKNNDGKVSDIELKDYLGETMTYYARRYYGRDQNVQIMQGN